jgi:zinc transporter, ZIP family
LAEAFGWGTLAASSLIVGALIALRVRIPVVVIGLIMAFGAGVLISAVAFDLIEEAVDTAGNNWSVLIGLFAGCAVYFIGDRLVARLGGADRKDAQGAQEGAGALGIVLGTVLDGVPESIVIGLTIVKGGAVGASYLIAVFISNLPEAISATTGLVAGGWKPLRILRMWIAITIVSGLASLLGYGLFDSASGSAVALVLGFAAGGILTMLAETMMPEAFDHARDWVGVATTLGFATAFLIHTVS